MSLKSLFKSLDILLNLPPPQKKKKMSFLLASLAVLYHVKHINKVLEISSWFGGPWQVGINSQLCL